MLARLLAPVAALLVASGVVLFDPSAAQALAPAPPIPRVYVPSSVIGSLDGLTAAQRAAAVGNVVPVGSALRIPAGVANVTKLGGRLFGYAGVFISAFSATNQVLIWSGADPANVGMTALWPSAFPVPVPDLSYAKNGDVIAHEPGWTSSVRGFPHMGYVTSPLVYQQVVTTFSVSQQAEGLSNLAIVTTSSRTGTITAGQGEPQQPSNGLWYYCRTTAGVVKGPFNGGTNGAFISPQPVRDFGPGASAPTTKTGVTPSNFPMNPTDENTCNIRGQFDSTLYNSVLDHFEVRWFTQATTSDGSTPPNNVGASYYPIGNPNRPADSSTDPMRAWEARWTCSGGSAGVLRSALFHETDAAWPKVPDSTCSVGKLASVEIWEVTPDGSAPAVRISTWTPTTALQDLQNNRPECLTGACQLALSRVQPDGQTIACASSPSACVNWWTTVEPLRSERYQCSYGGTAVATTECAALAVAYNVSTNTQLAPAPQGQPQPLPITEVAPIADPKTGNPVPRPAPSGTPAPTPAPTAPGTPAGDCPPAFEATLGGLGYWVTKGVTCALAYAFVPSQALNTAAVSAAWQGTAFGTVGNFFGGLAPGMFMPSTTSCGEIVHVQLDVLGHQPMVVSTCGKFWQDVGVLRTLGGIAFIAAATILGVRLLLRTIRIDAVPV